jgi:hypothetical protein
LSLLRFAALSACFFEDEDEDENEEEEEEDFAA